MDFTEDMPTGSYIVRSYTTNSITINEEIYQTSVYVSPDKLIRDIKLRSANDLSINSIQFILDFTPELLILGTGEKLIFPPGQFIAALAQQNIGFEAMDHAAACRTYAVLCAEQRRVGALFLLGD